MNPYLLIYSLVIRLQDNLVAALLLLSVGLTQVQAQVSNFHQYTIDDGLASNSVYGAMQDREGYIWIYTEDGISKFDGYTFENIYEGLPRYDVWDLKEDSKGRLWVHTVHNRLVYIYKDSIHEVKTSVDYQFYLQSFYDNAGDVWFQGKHANKTSGSTHFSIERDSVIFYSSLPRNEVKSPQQKRLFSKESNYYMGFLITPNIYVLLKKDSLLYLNNKYEIQEKKSINTDFIKNMTSAETAISTNINLIEDSSLFRILDKEQILKWDIDNEKGHIKNFQNIYDYPIDPFYTILSASDSALQLSLMPQPGFLELDFDLNMVDTFTVKGLKARRIFKDRAGNFWIATSGDGIYFASAASRNAKSIIPNKVGRISGLTGDRNGTVYISTESSGIYSYSDNKVKQILPYSEIGSYPTGVVTDRSKKLYVGGDKGVFDFDSNYSFSPSSINKLPSADYDWLKPPKTAVKSIKVLLLNEMLGKKQLWFSTGLKVQYLELETETKPQTDYFGLIEIESLQADKKGQIWAGGKDGLWLFEDNAFVKRRYNHDVLDLTISDMAIDDKDVLWCSVEGHKVGVIGLKSDTLYSIASTAGLKINDLFIDKRGFLWVATTQGLLQYEIDYNNLTDQKLIRKYTTTDGLNTREVTAVYVDDEYIYAGTNKGLTQVSRHGKYGDNSAPLLYIKDIRINGNKQDLSNSYELAPSQNDLEIDFVALSYKSLADIVYTYQLVGVDEDWEKTQNRNLRYPNLPSGKYSFQLKATDIDNNNVILAEPIQFYIKKALWNQVWFRLLVIALVAMLLWLLNKKSINTIRRKEEEKTRIAKQIAELEMKALQAQMNPHFVFNSLASIRYYIQNNKADEAGDYLVRFSKLMRLFLESSKSNFTTLENEIKLISLYVEMEQLRFEELFDFELEIGENLDIYLDKIPTLLLQPFVENAINHGLFHKEGKGKLQVSFRLQKKEILECIIEDDGIGQAAAKVISERSSQGHKSRAMQIVEERLEVLKYKDDIEIEIDVIDLEDKGEPVGTRIVIRIHKNVFL